MRLPRSCLATLTGTLLVFSHPLYADPDAACKIPININTADVHQLTCLRGIGESLADRILQFREKNGRFKSVSDLANVKGISEKRLDRWKSDLVVEMPEGSSM